MTEPTHTTRSHLTPWFLSGWLIGSIVAMPVSVWLIGLTYDADMAYHAQLRHCDTCAADIQKWTLEWAEIWKMKQ